MNVKPPRVPPAATVAGSATQGPRVVPGTYTVRMTKGDKTYETKVQVGSTRALPSPPRIAKRSSTPP